MRKNKDRKRLLYIQTKIDSTKHHIMTTDDLIVVKDILYHDKDKYVTNDIIDAIIVKYNTSRKMIHSKKNMTRLYETTQKKERTL
jgi:hypothetical protein